MPSSEFTQDLLNPLIHAFFSACQLWTSHQAPLRLVLMGYTSRQICTAPRRLLTELRINAPPVFCGFSCWQDSAGAVLCSSAGGQHVHHWHQHGQRPGVLWYLIHQHLRDQDHKGVFACVYVQICSCLCALPNENNVSRDQKTEWKHQKNLPLINQFTLHHSVGLPVWRQMIDESDGVRLSVCLCVRTVSRMRHVTPGRTGACCCQRL